MIHRLQTDQGAEGFNNMLADCAGPGADGRRPRSTSPRTPGRWAARVEDVPAGIGVEELRAAYERARKAARPRAGPAVVVCRTHPSTWTEAGAWWETGSPATSPAAPTTTEQQARPAALARADAPWTAQRSTPCRSRDRTIGVGVIGAGWLGDVHARAWARLRHHYPELAVSPRFVAVADSVPAAVATAVRKHGFATTYDDWRDLVADPAVEAVSVTAPNALHREIGVAVAEAGKHLWIEKPVGLSRRTPAPSPTP